MNNEFQLEELQEALIELKQSREREQRLCEENHAILAAISEMSEAENRFEIFFGLNTVLKKYINFDDAVVLTRNNNNDEFKTLLTTNKVFEKCLWNADKKFTRVMNGECIILYDPQNLPEFTALSPIIKNQMHSVLLTGINAQVTQYVILFIGRNKGHFSIASKETLKRFRPLIERAIIDIENKERLQSIVDVRTQQLAKAREEAEQANKAKSEFLAMMSHELRTPLNSVLGMLDVLKQSEINQRQMSILEQMEYSAELLLIIISDILDISRIESGRFSLLEQWTNLDDTVTFAISQQRPSAQRKNLELNLVTQFDKAQQYWLDPTRISQILFNLVGNAVKFTEHGRIDVTVKVAENKLTIRVTDSGIGIEESKLKQLFKAFQQADNSITRRFGGTGLGLTITKYLVELMSGSIDVSSEPDKGSTFTVNIPILSKSITETGNNPSAMEHSGRVLNMLVVEDTHSNQMVIQLLLSRQGHNVYIANNGKEAVDFVKENKQPLDLILMDISMPQMDGITATKILRRDGFTIPIIALTAHALENDKERCLSAGMDSFLSKPIRKRDLNSTLCALGLLNDHS